MTLLVNEIHVLGDLQHSLMLFAADRRITLPGKTPPKFMKKVYEIPHLNAGIGYYGLAEMSPNVYFSGWLPNFINNASEAKSLHDFAAKLVDALNQSVTKVWLRKRPSGLHLCGHNANGFPELWHICNHEMHGNVYTNLSSQYRLSEDFLKRDAPARGFDGTNPSIRQPFIQYYVNGDVRAFHSVWRRLDEFLAEMFSYGDFKRPQRPHEYIEVVKWKMWVVASFYKRFAKQPVIGGPIDAFPLVR